MTEQTRTKQLESALFSISEALERSVGIELNHDQLLILGAIAEHCLYELKGYHELIVVKEQNLRSEAAGNHDEEKVQKELI